MCLLTPLLEVVGVDLNEAVQQRFGQSRLPIKIDRATEGIQKQLWSLIFFYAKQKGNHGRYQTMDRDNNQGVVHVHVVTS